MTPQSVDRSHHRWAFTSLAILLTVLLVVPAAAQSDFGQPAPGQRVYDRAGVLSAEQVASLESQAAAVYEAGAPAYVYLQPRDSDVDGTIQDARDLMDAWEVQSAADARDGVVIFFNLDPDDFDHGDFAVVAGESLIDGNLPQRELDRITGEMQPLLDDGDIAGAIGLALSMIERDLRDGPPPPPEPSGFEQLSNDIAEGALSILNVVAVVVAAVVTWLLARARPKRRKANAPVTLATAPPDALQPALAGALVNGSVSDAQIAATILDLAARGALAVEPDGKKKVRIHLLDESMVRNGYERGIWHAFAQRADADGIVSGKHLSESRKDWGSIRAAIQRELDDRGWFDPAAGQRRMPFYLAAAGLFSLAIVAVIFAATAESLWAIAAVVVLTIVAVLAFGVVLDTPTTTPEGDHVATPWRGYQRYLKSAGKQAQVDLDLDTVVPYAVALGAGNALDKRLKAASADGYLPVWLGGTQPDAWTTGFYPYWIAFNSSIAPTSSTTASTGASTGSGASGGSF